MTRVRIIYQIGPSTFTGKVALMQVTKVCAGWGYKTLPLTGRPFWRTVQELVTRTRANGHDLGRFLIYREPRKVKAKHSAYKQMLRTIFAGGDRLQRARVPARPTPAHPKRNKPRSRTVKLLEQELTQQEF